MTDTPLKVSSKFPEGYGNLAIQSSDDIVCYFPGPILIHTSIVFRDMFEMPGSESKEAPVKVTEPIKILELFLTHLDPDKLSPPIDSATIVDLLCMADKYQVTKIVRWFKQEARLRHSELEADTGDDPFVITYPIICLSIATRFNLEHIGRIALRELSSCSTEVFLKCILLLDPVILHRLYQLRDKRAARYQAYVSTLTDHTATMRGKGCEYCTGKRAEWIQYMTMAVQHTPKWSRFKEAFHKGRYWRCVPCKISWTQCFSDRITLLEEAAQKEECELPDWPL
jgi:hypothetical protein